jgi:hypothetical protein
MKLSAALLSVSLLPGLLLGACASNGVSVPWTSDLLVVEKSGARMVLRDPANGALRRVYETGAGPHEVFISFDSRWAVIANYGGQEPGSTLTVCDLVAGSVVRTIDLGGAVRPHGLAFLTNKEGAQLVAVTAELRDQILVVDISTGQIVRTLAAGGELPHMLVASSDGKQLYVTCMKSGEVVQLDAVIAKYELELPGIVSSRLAQKQLELIESRADDLLAWFCNTNIDDQSALNLEVRES